MTAANHNADDSAEQAEYQAAVKAWYDANATPKRHDSAWETNVHRNPADARRHFLASKAWQGRLFEAGLAGIAWPKQYGGGGGKSWMARIEREVSLGYEEWVGFVGATIAMLGPTLLRHGTEEQKRDLLPKLLSAELSFCQLFSEPGAGSDLAALATRAERDGDEFIVNGQKVWNSSAQFCDWGFVLVRTDPDAPKHKGITFLLVDMSSPGVEVRPLVQINQSAHFNEVFLSGVRVPVANVIGEINQGWSPARTVLSNESAFIAGARIPTRSKLIELAGDRGLLGDLVVRQELASYYSRELISGWMGEQVHHAIRRGGSAPMDPGLIKLMASQNRRLSGDLACRILGVESGAGSGEKVNWAQMELLGRYSISIGGGTDEVLKNNIGERSLQLPREPGYDKNQPWREIPRS